MSATDGTTPEHAVGARRSRRGRTAALLAAAVATLAVGLPGVAHAAGAEGAPSAVVRPSGSVCANGAFCLWPGKGMSGKVDPLNALDLGGCRQQDRLSRSGENNSLGTVTVWELPGCEGRSTVLRKGKASADFGFAARAVESPAP